MHFSTLAKRSTLLLFLVLIAFYCYGLGHLPLVGPDEPRYTQVAREMFLRRDLITPTLGGRSWFEKPVLLYWMMMASFKVFGVSEWSARLPSAISGLLTIAACFVIGRRLNEAESAGSSNETFGWWGGFVAATTVGIFVFSRAASFDIVLTMTITWALAFFLFYQFSHHRKTRPSLLLGFYVFVGLSLLAKGLVGIVIPFGVIGLYYLFLRQRPLKHDWLTLVWGIPVTLLVAATWYAPVIWRNGWPFVDQFFIQHHFARYISDKYHHWRPVYYYLQVIPLLALPWTVFLVDGLIQRFKALRHRPGSSGLPVPSSLSDLMTFVLAWFLFPFLFFSFSSSKLPGYILPLLPAGALIVGERVWRLRREAQDVRRLPDATAKGWTLRITAILCLLFAVGMFAYVYQTGAFPLICTIVVTAVLLAVGLFALIFRRLQDAAVVLLGFTLLGVLIVALHCLAPAAADQESSKRLLQLADVRGYSQAMIYGMQRSDRTPEFYAAGRVAYGSDGEPIMYEAPWDVIQESRRRQEAVLAFVPLAELDRLAKTAGAQTEVIGDNGKYAIVAVRAL